MLPPGLKFPQFPLNKMELSAFWLHVCFLFFQSTGWSQACSSLAFLALSTSPRPFQLPACRPCSLDCVHLFAAREVDSRPK